MLQIEEKKRQLLCDIEATRSCCISLKTVYIQGILGQSLNHFIKSEQYSRNVIELLKLIEEIENGQNVKKK
jgi:hypothetical protein